MHPFFAFLISLLLFASCHNKPKSSGYTIAIDPTWYPLHLGGRENHLLPLSIELLAEIAKIEDLQISVVRMNWNNLMWGLQKRTYSAILSTMCPYSFYLKEYAFSLPYLLTGPVIVLPKAVKSNQIEGKEIGVVRGSSAALILQTTPNIILQGHDSIPDIFKALETQQIDGAALEALAATSYLRDLFPGKFRIASEPLNNMGLRLISIQGAEPVLMKRFDRGLKALKKSGTYDKLLEKWGFFPDWMPAKDLDKKGRNSL